MSLRSDALAIYRAALTAADAAEAVHASWTAVSKHLATVPKDRIFLLALGKAAIPMADAIQYELGRSLDAGLMITKYGHAKHKAGRRARAAQRCAVLESGHPVPDASGVIAAQRVEDMLRQLNARDLLIVALSGGGSALLPAPVPGITLSQKQEATRLLLEAGAGISELNAVRKHLSRLKGGRLAALAYPASIVTLVLSDVIGDRLDVIASGPTAPDPTTYEDALNVLDRYGLLSRVPPAVRRHLKTASDETPKPGDPLFQNVHTLVVGSNRLALSSAAKTARKLGYRALILSSEFEGEARELGRMHAAVARSIVETGQPLRAPACVLSGGEPTVTVRGNGLGGRAQEFALSAAIDLEDLPNCLVASIGTDGSDGPTDAAGAIVTGATLAKGRALGRNARYYLARNDSYHFFEGNDALIKTGPTGTNVMDLNLILVRAV